MAQLNGVPPLGNTPKFPPFIESIGGYERLRLQLYLGGQGSTVFDQNSAPLTSSLGGQLEARLVAFAVPPGNGVFTLSIDQDRDTAIRAPRGTSLVQVAFTLPTILTPEMLSTQGYSYAYLLIEED